MSGTENLIKVLLESINRKKKTSAYDTQATVLRVENDIAWVHIPGGIDETPVRLTIAASPGDTVQVRVSGGAAWITGNSTAPPTDDRTAKQAVQTAEEAHVEAAKAVEQTAENTRAIGQQAQSIQNNYQAITRIDTTAVTGVVVQYAKSDSPTTPPTRGWSDASPTWESGKYIWQRTVTTIDGEQIISNVSCIQGAKGEDGADGTSVTILGHYDTYAELTAAHPTGSSGDSYMVGSDLYVWNGSAWENVGQIQGPQGPAGPQGPQGPAGKDGTNGTAGKDGKDGTSSYVHIKYSSVANPSDSQMTETPSDYIGICTDSNVADPVTASSYTWSKWKGEDGTDGIPGTNGKDGASTYVHFAYANSSDGTSGFSTTPFAGAKYVGIRTDTTLADSTTPSDYEWSELKGDKGDTGRGIRSITAEYYLSTSNTTQTGGSWSATVPAYVEGRYYWTRSKIMWDDSNTPTYTTPVLDTAVTNANSTAYQALRRAGNAEDVANATKQYFWDDTDGVHISSEPDAPTATRNMLLNSLGMLFRRGANNLLALLTGTNPSVNIYDGRGNADSNVLAQFAASGVRIGKSGQTNIQIAPDQVEMTAPNGSTAMVVSYEPITDFSENLDYGIHITDEHDQSYISLLPSSDGEEFDGSLELTSVMENYTFLCNDGNSMSFGNSGFVITGEDDGWLYNIDPLGNVTVGYQKSPFIYEDVQEIVSYSAGTIGTRATAISLGATAKSGYRYVGATVLHHSNSSSFWINLVRNANNGNAYAVIYRASASAVDAMSITVRKMWVHTKVSGEAE